MNLWSVTAMGIGAMVGAGIFALLGVVALSAGDETYISFLLGGGVALLSGYSYAKLAMRYPDAGGIATFFDKAFGAGRLSGTLSLIFLLTIAATIGMVAKAFGAYAATLALGPSNGLWINVSASGAVIILTLLNVAGSKLVGKTELVLVGVKLTILTGLISAGAYGMMYQGAIKHVAPHVLSVIGSVGLALFAYAGYAVMPNTAGSAAHPSQTIPRAIYLAIGIVTLLYVLLAIVVVGSVPAGGLSRDADTALAVAARPLLGQSGYIVVSVTALLATASGINAWVFTAMQISAAMARADQLPGIFMQLAWRKGTRGLFVGVAAVVLAINFFDLTALANIASSAFVFSHMAVQVAHWRLIDETKGSRPLVGLALLSMAVVLVVFLWSTAFTEPWSVALFFVFIAGSWTVEAVLDRRTKERQPTART